MNSFANRSIAETATIAFFDLVDDNDTVNSTGCRNVTAGEQQTLQCKADGEPSPFLFILNEKGQEVAKSLRDASYSFTVTEEMNEKAYECKAISSISSVLNRTANSTISLCVSSSLLSGRKEALHLINGFHYCSRLG